MNQRMVGRIGLLVAICLLLAPQTTMAEAPYMTFTWGPEGRIVRTPDAYEPDGWIRLDFNRPEDVFYDDAGGMMYVADAGNARIAVVDPAAGGARLVRTIGEGVLQNPMGVYVTEDGRIYAADYGLKQVVVFDAAGNVLQRIGRPEEPIYGKRNDFAPKKVAVDRRGNIYVISEGSINGVVQLNHDGRFLGYVGANDTRLSLKMLLQRLLFTERQLAQLFRTTPPSPTSIVLDRQGLLYTVTNGLQKEGIKKLNILGNNILPDPDWVSPTLIDLDVNQYGIIYTIGSDGWMDIYDTYGNLLFDFGGNDSRHERAGFVKSPSAIDVTASGDALFVADRDRNVIHRYRVTPFGAMVFEGVELYRQGQYVQSEEIWKNILRMNSYFNLSYQALAKAYYKRDLDRQALESFRLAEDRQGYSDAFWNIRNEWLQENMGWLIGALAGLFVMRIILRMLHRRYGILRPVRRLADMIRKRKLAAELGFVFYFLRHPIDAVHELKENRRATVRSATILLAWFMLLRVILIHTTGYLFAGMTPERTDLIPLLLWTAVPLMFWIVMNYLVSTISDGEGKFSQVYVGTIYAFAPYLVFALPIALISNVLTYNEAFVYEYSMAAIRGWTALLVFIMIKELHNFTIRQTIRNLFLTVFGSVLAAVVLFLLVLLFDQEVEFVRAIVQEVRNRAVY